MSKVSACRRFVVLLATVSTDGWQPGQPIVVGPGPALPAGDDGQDVRGLDGQRQETGPNTSVSGFSPPPPPHELFMMSGAVDNGRRDGVDSSRWSSRSPSCRFHHSAL